MSSRPLTAAEMQPTTTASEQIGFRRDGSSAADQAVSVLLVLAGVLAALLVALWVARKRGWLDRWIATAPHRTSALQMRREEVLRLSQKTSIYRISDGENRYIVVESTASVQVLPSDAPGDTDA